MKKYIGIMFLVGFLLAPGLSFAQQADVDPQGGTSCAVITHNLRLGSRDANTGGDVSLLQDFLNSNKFLTAATSGYFGNGTFKAVKAFQKANNISPTGYVGAFTIAKIKEIDCGNTIATTGAPESAPGTAGNPIVTNYVAPVSINTTGPKMNDQKFNNDCFSGHKFSSITGKPCVSNLDQVNTTEVREVPHTVTPIYHDDCPKSGTPSIKVISPNGGETFTAGQQVTVKWISCNVPTSNNKVAILLQAYNNGQSITGMGLSVFTTNDGIEQVTLPTTLPSISGLSWGTNFKVSVGTVDNSNNPIGLDYSDNLFTVNSSSTTFPAGCTSTSGYSLTTGLACDGSQSNYTNLPAGCTSTSGYSLTTGLACDGSQSNYTNLPAGCTSTSGYSLTTGLPCNGSTPQTGCTSTSTPSITVTSPNGGETYTAGQQIPVTWTSCNVPNSNYVGINVIQYDSNNTEVDSPNVISLSTGTELTLNTGSSTIILPQTTSFTNFVSGMHYKIGVIRIASSNGSQAPYVTDPSVHGSSNNLFTINSSTVAAVCTPIVTSLPLPSTIIANGTSTLYKFKIENTSATNPCKLTGLTFSLDKTAAPILQNFQVINDTGVVLGILTYNSSDPVQTVYQFTGTNGGLFVGTSLAYNFSLKALINGATVNMDMISTKMNSMTMQDLGTNLNISVTPPLTSSILQ